MKSTFCFNASLKDSIASCKKYIENYFTRITATLSFPYLTEGLIRGLPVIFFFFYIGGLLKNGVESAIN